MNVKLFMGAADLALPDFGAYLRGQFFPPFSLHPLGLFGQLGLGLSFLLFHSFMLRLMYAPCNIYT